MKYIAIFKARASKPDLGLEKGWFSIVFEASEHAGDETVNGIAAYKMGMLRPWMKCEMELHVLERYHLRPEMAGPYRGLVVEM